ncbi:MAG: hypothetical protein H0X40_08315 [Chthoniobacterales bacterium]|nr:hypothetical protein [Chthoniobacterales bacterium]
MKKLKLLLFLTLLSLVSQVVRAGDLTTVPTPNVGKGANNLLGVAAAGDNDVWAVGDSFNQQASVYRTLIEHWDGARWSVVRSPNSTTSWNFLSGIAVNSASDIWSVGQALTGNIYGTLIERWDGQRWQVIPSPSVAGVSNFLLGVSVISTNDIWAVGYTQTASVFHPLSLHWDGASWTIVATPGQARLNSVDGVASNDVWAVGITEPGEKTLTMHWNGSVWSVVASPNDGAEDNILWAVNAISSNDVWSVGDAGTGNAIALHWNGTQWNLVPLPIVSNDATNAVLVGLAVRSSADIWATGQYIVPLLGSAEQTLVEHWDGASWSIVTSPNAKNSNNRLDGATLTPNGTLWTVGTVGPFGKAERTLSLAKTP